MFSRFRKRNWLLLLISIILLGIAAGGIAAFLAVGNAQQSKREVSRISYSPEPVDAQAQDDGPREEQQQAQDVWDTGTYETAGLIIPFDREKLKFEESAEETEEGSYLREMTSIFPIESGAALPRLDILPLDITAVTIRTINEAAWETVCKDALLAYYSEDVRSGISIVFDNVVVKQQGGGVKAYLQFRSEAQKEGVIRFRGAARMIADADSGAILLYLEEPGGIQSDLLKSIMVRALLKNSKI